jgi:hypothetical protein
MRQDRQTLNLKGQRAVHCGGVGVAYAYTMVHGVPATKLPEYAVPPSLLCASHNGQLADPWRNDVRLVGKA